MRMLNQIARIIFRVLDEVNGSPDENSGQSFLIIERKSMDDRVKALARTKDVIPLVCKTSWQDSSTIALTLG